MNWIEVPAGKYTLLDGPKKKTTCQIEIDVPSVAQLKLYTRVLNVYADTTRSSHIRQKEIGPRLRLYEFSVSILSVLVARVYSLNPMSIRSSK